MAHCSCVIFSVLLNVSSIQPCVLNLRFASWNKCAVLEPRERVEKCPLLFVHFIWLFMSPLSNADVVWQLSIQGFGSNWSTNGKNKIKLVERKTGGNKRGKFLPPPFPWSLKWEAQHGERFSRERPWFSWKVCICRKEVSEGAGFLRAQHNTSPSLIISQTWSALNALMLKEKMKSQTRPDKLTSATQGLDSRCKSHPRQKAEIIYALKYIQQNFNFCFLIHTFWTILSYLPTLKYSRKDKKWQTTFWNVSHKNVP